MMEEMLRRAEVRKENGGASKVPLLDVPRTLKIKAGKVQQAHAQMKTAETEYKLEAKEFVDKVAPLRNEYCKTEFVSSVNIPTDTGGVVQVTWQNKYSKIPMSKQQDLQTVYGERTSTLFPRKIEVKLKRPDATTFAILEEKLGVDLFADLFGVEMFLEPSEQFHREYPTYTNEQRTMLAGIVKQVEPSVKP